MKRVTSIFLTIILSVTLVFGSFHKPEKAYAFVPVIAAVPAGLAALGITGESLAIAAGAVITAVGGVSVYTLAQDNWDMLTDEARAQYGNDFGSYAEGTIAGILTGAGLYETTTNSNGDPELTPKGPKGEKFNTIMQMLATGALGGVALSGLSDFAGDILNFLASPDEEKDGVSTGLGVAQVTAIAPSTDNANKPVNLTLYNFASVVGSYGYPMPPADLVGEGFEPVLAYAEKGSSWLNVVFVKTNGTVTFTQLSDYQAIMKFSDSVTSYTMAKVNADKSWSRPVNPPINQSGSSTVKFPFDVRYNDRYVLDYPYVGHQSSIELLAQAANAPYETGATVKEIAQSGVGTEAATQAIADYVAQLQGSTQVVVMPETNADTADYDKVVTDPDPSNPPYNPNDPDKPTEGFDWDKLLNPELYLVFPFCLPWDLYDLISVFNASARAPAFSLPLKTPTGDYTVDVDLSEFDPVAEVCRALELLAFAVGLIFLTKRMLSPTNE